MSEVEQEGKAGKRNAVHRSPAYPAIDLKAALDRAQVFYMHERRAEAGVAVAVQHWGYSVSSSGGKGVLAALIAYGLMEDKGSGEQRRVRLTDLALRILLDERPDSSERDEAVRRAALMPKIHAELFARWPDELPSNPNLRHYLLIEKKFNENAVDDFIKELRITAEFAKLYAPSGVEVGLPSVDATAPSSSIAQEPEQNVESLLRPAPSQAQSPIPSMARPIAASANMRQDTFTLDEGQVMLQWPAQLSEDSYEDLKDWLELQLRKIRRGVQASSRDEGA
ncbi:Uncharacterised protein [Bordetella ansorpii]|uniref:Uncharacterized protein n=1 Tax=Bordetella ansorpii TaxID=288768 RepID=A0A157SNX8_9BORD|nr:hypothetical protein [Bordetella ansorpii]SAI72189.1 Uncharacterised protein [Bordetella ansorpii]